MRIYQNYLALMLCMSYIAVRTSEPAVWYDTADDILKSIKNFVEEFDKEVVLVPDLNKRILEAYDSFDQKDVELTFLFNCLEKEFNILQNTIETHENTIDTKELSLKQLQSEYNALNFETNRTIKKLDNTIADLEKKLKKAQQEYATLVDFNGEKAQQVIEAMQNLKTKYDDALTTRQEALDNVYELLKRINAFNVSSRSTIQEKGAALCDPDFINKLKQYIKEQSTKED